MANIIRKYAPQRHREKKNGTGVMGFLSYMAEKAF